MNASRPPLFTRLLMVFVMVASAMVAWAGDAIAPDGLHPASFSDKAAGIFAGAVLATLVMAALFIAARPLLAARDRSLLHVAMALAALWIAKTIAVLYCPGFKVDVSTYEAWALEIASKSPSAVYRSGFFLDYPPGYLYALWAAGAIARLLNAADPLLRVIVEGPALAADFALALLMFVVVRRHAGNRFAWLAAAFVALNPALLFDTVVWGQTDSVLALVLALSTVMMIDGEMELGWALAALALLIKPQALMLMPVLGLWTLIRSGFSQWWRSVLAFAAVLVVGVAPFQVGHRWDWLPHLYASTAAYYHETSVNAFNLMALIGGLRQPDTDTILGLSYFALGLALLVPIYCAAAWMLVRNPTPRNLWRASFLVLFGFFMCAPRMHERYIYAALVFGIPLALQESAMLVVIAVVTVTGLGNLAYVLNALNANVFLDARDSFAMGMAALNCVALILTAGFGLFGSRAKEVDSKPAVVTSIERSTPFRLARLRGALRIEAPSAETFAPFSWNWTDTILILVLTGAAAYLRFWHLWAPLEIVFDEVHFVGQARHYLHNEYFLDPHPPIAKLVIAAGIVLFGDHPASWRLGNATLGTVLIAVTYLLGRRMFRSRLAATIAAALVGLDGFFIVDSRFGCIDIVYLTFAAIAYLLLFQIMQTQDLARRRRRLIGAGIVLGLCLGSKLYIPAVIFLVVAGFIALTMLRAQLGLPMDDRRGPIAADSGSWRRTIGALLLTGSLAAIFYIASFTPHYVLGWWGGISDLFHYYRDVMGYEKSVSTATHPYASPWWSWPLMLRPVAYWQNFPEKGNVVATVWGAGNPLTWIAIIPAITVTAIRAIEKPNLTGSFLVVAFLAYYVIWIPIGRILFLYHYMPSAYIGYLALGGVLAEMWSGKAEWWESLSIVLVLAAVSILGILHIAAHYYPDTFGTREQIYLGLAIAVLWLGGFAAAGVAGERWRSRLVCIAFAAAAIVLFFYYEPIWLGTPITRTGYYARMWLQGPGLQNWI